MQAPVAGAMDWELAAAAAEAGALGSLPCAMLNADQVARADGENPRPHEEADQSQLLLSHAAGAQQRARGAMARDGSRPITASSASIRRRRCPRATATAFDAAFCDVVEEMKPEVVSFHFGLPEPKLVETGQGRGRRGAELGDHRRRGALARGARRRRDHRARLRGRRASRHVPDRRHRRPGRHLRAGAADRRCGEGAGDRRRRHHRCARHRGRLRARGRRRADRHAPICGRPEAKISAPHRAALEQAPRRRHRADQSDDRAAGARHHQPGDARDRADLGRGAGISARRRRARAAARQGGGAGLGRFLADVGGAGGLARPRVAGRRA